MGLEDSRQTADTRAGRVLDPRGGSDVFSHGRETVTGPAAQVAAHVWWVRWHRDRRRPWTQSVLTDPVLHLTVEETGPRSTRTGRPPRLHGVEMPAALVHGPVTRLWTVTLPLRGRTSGIAFHPGGFAALLGVDAGSLASRVVQARELIPEADELRDAVLGHEDEDSRRALLLDWLTQRHGRAAERLAADTAYRVVRRAADLMRSREHVRLDSVAEAVNSSPRSLHRWFTRYVGVSPLRVLRRHRLQDAVAALEAGEPDLARLAADLGWADHAHFGREFRAVVGVTPEAYRHHRDRPGREQSRTGHDQVTIAAQGQPRASSRTS